MSDTSPPPFPPDYHPDDFLPYELSDAASLQRLNERLRHEAETNTLPFYENGVLTFTGSGSTQRVFGEDGNALETHSGPEKLNRAEGAEAEPLKDSRNAAEAESKQVVNDIVKEEASRDAREPAIGVASMLVKPSAEAPEAAPLVEPAAESAKTSTSSGALRPGEKPNDLSVTSLDKSLAAISPDSRFGRRERLVMMGDPAIEQRMKMMASERGYMVNVRGRGPVLEASPKQMQELYTEAAQQEAKLRNDDSIGAAFALELKVPQDTQRFSARVSNLLSMDGISDALTGKTDNVIRVMVAGTPEKMRESLKEIEQVVERGVRVGQFSDEALATVKESLANLEKNSFKQETLGQPSVSIDAKSSLAALAGNSLSLVLEAREKEASERSAGRDKKGAESESTAEKAPEKNYALDIVNRLETASSTKEGLIATNGENSKTELSNLLSTLQGIDSKRSGEFASVPDKERVDALANMLVMESRIESGEFDKAGNRFSKLTDRNGKPVLDSEGNPQPALKERMEGWIEAERQNPEFISALKSKLEERVASGIIDSAAAEKIVVRAEGILNRSETVASSDSAVATSEAPTPASSGKPDSQAAPRDSASSAATAQASSEAASEATTTEKSNKPGQAATGASTEATQANSSGEARTSEPSSAPSTAPAIESISKGEPSKDAENSQGAASSSTAQGTRANISIDSAAKSYESTETTKVKEANTASAEKPTQDTQSGSNSSVSEQGAASSTESGQANGLSAKERQELTKQSVAALNSISRTMGDSARNLTNDDKTWRENQVQKLTAQIMKLSPEGLESSSPANRTAAAGFAVWAAQNAAEGRLPGFSGEDGAAKVEALTEKARELIAVADGKMPPGAAKAIDEATAMVSAMEKHEKLHGMSSRSASDESSVLKEVAPDRNSVAAKLEPTTEALVDVLRKPTEELTDSNVKFVLLNADKLNGNSLKGLPEGERRELTESLRDLVDGVRSGDLLGKFESLSDGVKSATQKADVSASLLEKAQGLDGKSRGADPEVAKASSAGASKERGLER